MTPRLKRAALEPPPTLTVEQVANLLPDRFRNLPTNKDEYWEYSAELEEALTQIEEVTGKIEELTTYKVMQLLGTSPADYFRYRLT